MSRDPRGIAFDSLEDGFTLLELLVTIAIMALITGIAFPALQNRLDAATWTQAQTALALSVAEAHSDAVAGARTVRLAVSRDGGMIYASAARLPVALPRGVTLAAPGGGFLFYPDGTSHGGSGQISAGTKRERFTIDGMTGRIAFLP